MTKRKRLYVLFALFFAVVAALVCAFTLSACKNNKDKDDTVSGTGTYGVGEEGTYYSVDLDTEYILTLYGGTYTLTMENIANSEGTYSYDTSSGAITFTSTGGEIFTGIFAEGNINLTTSAGTYLFQPRTTVTVTFMVNGSVYSTQDLTIGTTATAIQSPAVPDGYAFGGWYTTPEWTTRYSFGTAVTGSVTLYAKLIEIDPSKEVYEVTFVNGSNTTKGETVNSTIILPDDDGSILGWWVCWDGDATMPMYVYEEDTPVTEDTTLLAVENGSIGASVYGDKITVKGAVSTWNVYIKSSDGTAVENGSFTSYSSSYTYAFSSLPTGIYTVEVSAQGFTTEKLTYVSNALDKVSVIYAQDEYLVFKAVGNATSYAIEITYGGTTTTETINAAQQANEYLALDISGYDMPKDGISFTIKASAEGYISSTSKTFVLIRELAKITGLTIDSEKDEASWTAVENAAAYEVTVSTGAGAQVTATVTNTTYSFKYYGFGDEISVTVKPTAAGYYSEDSSTSASYKKATLAAPQNIAIQGSKITWDAVTDAAGYVVSFNGTEIPVETGVELTLDDTYTIEETNTISVKAVAGAENTSGAKDSQWSDEIIAAGGENATTTVTYLGDGVVTWDYILGVDSYTVSVTKVGEGDTEESAGTAGTPTGNTANVTFSASGEITITVSWTPAEGGTKSASTTVTVYSVSFSSTGGDSYNPVYVAQGDELTLPDAQYGTSNDYTFGGWYTAQHTGGIDPEEYVGEGYLVQSGDAFTWDQDITLYAYWPSVRFTVTLVIDKAYTVGSASDASEAENYYSTVDLGYLPDGTYYTDVGDDGNTYVYVTVAKGSTTYILPTPESTDAAYAFVGWFSSLYITYGHYWSGYQEGVANPQGNGVSTKDEEEGYRYAGIDGKATKAVTSDITLYAKWAQVLDFSSTTYNGDPVLSVGAHYE
ncbi:MAG: InlB B-repeat-containing protein, partial [Bacteroidales bacterium]|nr:InlB B-repeat-containing protein [Bacteroidales bacterium]